jgi:arylsulfatase A-like enzyme
MRRRTASDPTQALAALGRVAAVARPLAPIVLAIGFAILAPAMPRAAAGDAAPRQAQHPYNVLVVTIDSLRPDRLGCYGYDRPTSPNLDAFARHAVRFTNAFATSSFTPPSHASLFTSRYVDDHGLVTWNPLPEQQLTLAEMLATYGYRTGASVNLKLLSKQNLGQGFQWRREGHGQGIEEGSRDARELVNDAFEFIRTRSQQPYFLWIHLYDVHRPYGRSPNWTRMFARDGRLGVGDSESDYNLTPEDVRQRGLTATDLRYLADRYDAGIAYTDAQLAPLLAELSTPERTADTLIVVTADHGESLLDHEEQLFTHDPFLLASVTRVPLLIRYPTEMGAGRTVDALISLIDIAPTILAVLGVPRPAAFDGLDLAPYVGGAPLERAEIFMEHWGTSQLKAARSLRWLAIHDVEHNTTSYYDIASDPGEQHALSDVHDETALGLAKRLATFSARQTTAPKDPPALDPDVVRGLKALGYIGN